jgi:hypothetical protein
MTQSSAWTQKNFIHHDESEETQYPSHYLKCEKLINDEWVTTGWAPHEKAAKQHAVAVGGRVRVSNNDLVVLFEQEEVLDTGTEMCEYTCSEHD